MSLWTRIANAIAANRLNRELNEEYEAHIAEAIASGRDPEEARRSFGPLLRHREASRQYRVSGWLESLRIDLVFGLRQLKRNKLTSIAAILSLGLAMGSCVGAFRLIDALLWRPLPIAHPEQLHALWWRAPSPDGVGVRTDDSWSYPEFQRLKTASAGQFELMAASYTERTDLTYSSDAEMEKAQVQNVSGSFFGHFGLQPAAGRLLTQNDDQASVSQPAAVISYDYWMRRFSGDPKVIGATVHIGSLLYQIVGVVNRPFTGVEPGTFTDVFLPVTSSSRSKDIGFVWLRIFTFVAPGTAIDPTLNRIQTVHQNYQQERTKQFGNLPAVFLNHLLHQQVLLEPASTGVSDLQHEYRHALGALAVLVALVLLIACVNVANLMTAQAAARAHEMALRVSIGAGRLRLVQLVLAESALLASFAAIVGGVLAWWSAPFVAARIDTPNVPAHLVLPADWRVALFALTLIVFVMLLLGLVPALRASSVRPITALKGAHSGGVNPQSRKRQMHAMIAAQVAFCFLVVFFAGIFVVSFDRLSKRPIGFDPNNLVLLETVTDKPVLTPVWEQVGQTLRPIAGVESVALSDRPLLEGGSWSGFITVHGAQVASAQANFLNVSPDWFETMKIHVTGGRDIRSSDRSPHVAVVNETFARTFFPGQNPIGDFYGDGDKNRTQIIGIVQDEAYATLRREMLPVAFLPYNGESNGKPDENDHGYLVLRMHPGMPLAVLAPTLRKAVAQAHAGFRVSNVSTELELIAAQTIRERLLAMLAAFFAVVALLLAGLGLFGVLNYTVQQRRRELGIRIAVGARRLGIAGLVARPIFAMIVLGAAVGITAGTLAARSIETLFYAVKATDVSMLTLPAAAILSVAILAVLPAIRRAIHTDPAEILRAE